ncbi:MAG: hypothetical protein RH948_03690 [Cyclobacteriaceae bacterium]
MNFYNIFSYCFLIISFIGCAQKAESELSYLDQEPPTLAPKIFAPGLISRKDLYEFGSVFNADATEFYYGVNVKEKSEIWYATLEENHWSEPRALLPDEKYGHNDPFLSPDEQRLYFISKRSGDGLSEKDDHDIWYVERTEVGWSQPINAGPNINSDKNEYYISFTRSGTMYFSSNIKEENRNDFDIYYSRNVNESFQKPVALGDSVNTSAYEADVFVDPDESYIIFCASRREGMGQGDLYISFKNADGTWTKSQNMGSPINTASHELCPFVSGDGKYLFYTSNEDIYWVDADIIDQYRNRTK